MSNVKNYIEVSTGIRQEMLNEITVLPMTDCICHISESIVKPNQCYDNTLKILQRMLRVTTQTVKYVLGMCVCNGVFPIEHAWLKVGDTYYDPTLEIVVGQTDDNDYFSVMEFDLEEAIDAMESVADYMGGDYYPPMFDAMRYSHLYKHVYLSRREQMNMFKGQSISL